MVVYMTFRRYVNDVKVTVAILATSASAWAVKQIFPASQSIINADNTTFVGILMVMVLAQFVINSVLVAVAISIKTEKHCGRFGTNIF